ncbi:MAG: DUF3097 domain-containing protein [Microlunatus sp.]|nr:DUF3097 domain-containing protein [Microlunatus sp.]
MNRYDKDVLASGWRQAHITRSEDLILEVGTVIEDATTGYCGAVVRWENGLVVLEDRNGRRRSFPIGPGFLLEGRPVALRLPPRGPKRVGSMESGVGRTASGSVAGPAARARTALPSRIYVEGRHDAELVEKVWGDDLRHEGVVVEYLGGVDDIPAIVAEFAPARGRRLGVLVDHLVPGSKESRIVDQVAAGPGGDFVLVTGHPYIDIWQAVKPQRVGLDAWPEIPRSVEWKQGICAALGWPHAKQADIAAAWQKILGQVHGWSDLERELLTQVEILIDFVTQDHLARD